MIHYLTKRQDLIGAQWVRYTACGKEESHGDATVETEEVTCPECFRELAKQVEDELSDKPKFSGSPTHSAVCFHVERFLKCPIRVL